MQTATIADRLAETLANRGYDTTVVDADDWPTELDVADFDAVHEGDSASPHRPSDRRLGSGRSPGEAAVLSSPSK